EHVRIVGMGQDGRDQHWWWFKGGAGRDAVSSWGNWIAIYEIPVLRPYIVSGNCPKEHAIKTEDICPLGLAQPDGVFGHCVEHRLQIRRRFTDDLEYLARRRLLLQ